MNVLSLFDGMSCGQIALNKANIKYNKYFACEIKENAIKVTQHNYPNTIQLGNVKNVKGIDLPQIDLLIGGSPCQDFSRGNATRDGLQGFKSGLFFEYLRLLKELKPKYWLLENVIMNDADYSIISKYVGTEPVRINSSKVSAQLRDRLYWTNIGPEYFDMFGARKCAIPQPKDKKIQLKDILENGFTDREKSRALLESDSRPLRTQLKMFHRYYNIGFTTLVFKDEEIYKEAKVRYEQAMPGQTNQLNPSLESRQQQPYMQNRVFADTGKAPCLTQFADRLIVFENKGNMRYLTQKELERLQTVPEGYTSILKRDDSACLLGDGWTVDVIVHIFNYMKL
jgi:DNA-cytosine methyltransferase